MFGKMLLGLTLQIDLLGVILASLNNKPVCIKAEVSFTYETYFIS